MTTVNPWNFAVSSGAAFHGTTQRALSAIFKGEDHEWENSKWLQI